MKLTNLLVTTFSTLLLVGCSSGESKSWFDSVLPKELDSVGMYLWAIFIVGFISFGIELLTKLPSFIATIICLIIVVYYRDYGFWNVLIIIGTPFILGLIKLFLFPPRSRNNF